MYRKSEIWAKCQEQDQLLPVLEGAEGGSRSETLPWCIPGPPLLLLLSLEKPVSKMHRDGSPSKGSGSLHSLEVLCQHSQSQFCGSSQLVLSPRILRS